MASIDVGNQSSFDGSTLFKNTGVPNLMEGRRSLLVNVSFLRREATKLRPQRIMVKILK